MTREQAEQVKRWRMLDDQSWRSIAEGWVDQYGEIELLDEYHPGNLSGNQLVGMTLCERASRILGELVD